MNSKVSPRGRGDIFAIYESSNLLVGRFSVLIPAIVCLQILPGQYLACLILYGSTLYSVTSSQVSRKTVPGCQSCCKDNQELHLPAPLSTTILPNYSPMKSQQGTAASLHACCPQDCGRTGRSQRHCHFPHQSLTFLKSSGMIFHSRKTRTPRIWRRGKKRKELVRNVAERSLTFKHGSQ